MHLADTPAAGSISSGGVVKYFAFLSGILAFLLNLQVVAAPLDIPTYTWQPEGRTAAGIYVRGDVIWQKEPCSETEMSPTARLQKFPILKYKMLLKDKLDQHEGYYCWNMQLPEKYVGQLVHINLIRVFGKAKLWINYESVWTQATESEIPERLDFLYHVRSPLLRVEFSLTCGDSPLCGFRGAFKVRTELEGGQIEQRSRSLDFFAFAGLAFCFAYHFVFAFLRRRYNAAMMIAMMAFCLCVRIVLTGQGQLHNYFHIAESLYWRLEVLAVTILIPSTISMSRAIFLHDSSARIEKIAWIMAGSSTFLLMFATSSWFLPLMVITYLMIFMTVLSFCITIKNGLKNRRSATYIFAFTAITIIGSTVLEVLNTRVNIELSPGAHPMGFLLSSIIASVLFSKRISEAFTHAEEQEQNIHKMTSKLNEEIELFDQRIEERTQQISLLIQSLPTGIILINQDEEGRCRVNGSYSKFLTESLGIDVHDWPSFHKFLGLVHKDLTFANAAQLEQEFASILHDYAASDTRLRSIGPEQCTWKFHHASQRLDPVELRLVWVPIRDNESVSGIYLFLLDITHLTKLQREALRLDTEMGALVEIMHLTPQEARILKDGMDRSEWTKVQAIAREKNLGLLTRLVTQDGSAPAFAYYLNTLNLLFRSYFNENLATKFDLEEFLKHPLWAKHVPPHEYQAFLNTFIEAPRTRAS